MATKQILSSNIQTEGSARKRRSRRNNNTMNDEIYESVPPSTLGTSFVQVDISQARPKQGKSKQEMKVDKDMSNLKSDDINNSKPILAKYVLQKSKYDSAPNVEEDKLIKKKVDSKKPTYAIFEPYMDDELLTDYLESLAEPENIYSDTSQDPNFKSEIILNFVILRKYLLSSKMQTYLNSKPSDTLHDFIEFLITSQDNGSTNQHEDIFVLLCVLFDSKFSPDVLIEYDTIKPVNARNLEPYYNWIAPREETQVKGHFKYMLYKMPLFNYVSSISNTKIFKDAFQFVSQYNLTDIDGNQYKYDYGFAIKNYGAYTTRLFLEVQEESKGHTNSADDDRKKMAAIMKNLDIMYFKMYDYRKDPSILTYHFNRFYNYLVHLILDSSEEYRKEFLVYKYINTYRIKEKILLKEQSICKDEDRLIEIEDELEELKDKKDAEDTLKQIFKWKEESLKMDRASSTINVQNNTNNIIIHDDMDLIDELDQNIDGINNINNIDDYNIYIDKLSNNTNKVIELETVFKRTQCSQKNKKLVIDTYNKLIKVDNNIKLIDWKLLATIIINYSNADIRASLVEYLLNVEFIYEYIIKLSKKYFKFHENNNTWSKYYKIEIKNENIQKQLEALREENKRLKNDIDLRDATYNTFYKSTGYLYDLFKNTELADPKKSCDLYKSKDYMTFVTFEEILEKQGIVNKNIKSSGTKKNYIMNPDEYKYNYRTNGKVIFINRPDIDIRYNPDKKHKEDCIKYGKLRLIFNIEGVPEKIGKEFITECLESGINLTEDSDIRFLDINPKYIKLINQDINNKVDEADEADEADDDDEADEADEED